MPPLEILGSISAMAKKFGTHVAVNERKKMIAKKNSKWPPYCDDVIRKFSKLMFFG